MHKNDFKEKSKSAENCYDMEFDKGLIEASFAMQYGIRLSYEPDITISEYYRLLVGIMPDTPLGRIVQIRMEKDPDTLKKFGEYEKGVRNEWLSFKANYSKKEQQQTDEENLKKLQNMLKSLFS